MIVTCTLLDVDLCFAVAEYDDCGDTIVYSVIDALGSPEYFEADPGTDDTTLVELAVQALVTADLTIHKIER